jgi:hypothetical protein
MTRRLLLFSLWCSSLVLFVLGASETYELADASSHTPASISVASLAIAQKRSKAPAVYDSAMHEIVEGNVFRRDRSPAEPMAQSLLPIPKPVLQRPHLELRGLMGGPPWEVLLEGMPGHQSSVLMRVGQSIGGIKLTAVTTGTVVLRGADTVWHLTLRK